MFTISVISYLALVSAPASSPAFVQVPQNTFILPVNIAGAVNLNPACDGTNNSPLALRSSPRASGPEAVSEPAPGSPDNTISVFCQVSLESPSLQNADIAINLKNPANVGLVLCDQTPCKPTAVANLTLSAGVNTPKFEAAQNQLGTLAPGTLYYSISFISTSPSTDAIPFISGVVPVEYTAGGTQVGNGLGNIAIQAGGSSASTPSPLPSTPASSATAAAANCSLGFTASSEFGFRNLFCTLIGVLLCLSLRHRQARQRKEVRIHLDQKI